MIGFFIRLAASVVGLFLVAHFSNGAVVLHGFTGKVIAALVLGFTNTVIKTVLYLAAKSVTCVFSCITLGLWSLILSWLLNGLIFFCAGQWLPGFHVATFSVALWGALALGIINAIASVVTRWGDK